MQIHGFNKLTLLDYPGHLGAMVFLGGCNMRCPFCQNASLVLNPSSLPVIPEDEIFSLLKRRKNILEGVCISGGEPTIYDELPDFIKRIKDMGYLVKLDTNGTNPSMLTNLIEHKLIDYVAMDIKNSKSNYALTSGKPAVELGKIEESVAYLISSPLSYEFRTTVIKELHSEEDFHSIGKWIFGAKSYYLQAFKDSGDLITSGLHAPSKETLNWYASILAPYVEQIQLRGID